MKSFIFIWTAMTVAGDPGVDQSQAHAIPMEFAEGADAVPSVNTTVEWAYVVERWWSRSDRAVMTREPDAAAPRDLQNLAHLVLWGPSIIILPSSGALHIF